jgi:spore maturation protein CgeB
MRIFQIIHKYNPYIPYFENKYNIRDLGLTYSEHRNMLRRDRFYSPHILKPALNNESHAFYTMWNYSALQIKWAQERGWKETDLKKILFAQIEDFKPDVFYSCSPIHFKKHEINNIGNHKMIKIAWFASPEKNNIDFSAYNTRLTNYPIDVRKKSETNYRTDLFQPSIDPEMADIAESNDREVDIFFYGQYYPDYFKTRNKYIDKLIELKKRENWNIRIALLYNLEYKTVLPRLIPKKVRNSRFTKWFRLKNKIVFPLEVIRENTVNPYYGIDLYNEISKSKIVFNAAVDFSGEYKVNMRNIETLGCAAHMISDDGIYPKGLEKGSDFTIYHSFEDFVEKVKYFLSNPEESRKIALKGYHTVHNNFSKEIQWQKFQKIVENLK